LTTSLVSQMLAAIAMLKCRTCLRGHTILPQVKCR